MDRQVPKRYLFILLLPFGWFLNNISMKYNLVTERYYSNGIYKLISRIVGKLLGWLPFSAAEILLPLLILAAVWRLVVLIKGIIRNRRDVWILLRNYFLNGLLIISLIYFSFIVLWGLNYNRMSYSQITGLELRPSSKEELIELAEALLEDANNLRQGVDEDESGVMVPFGGSKGGFARYAAGYEAAAKYVPELHGVYSRPKPLLFSPIIAYTNIWGIYSPFTVESNVNMMIPSPMLLSTMMHEIAHQAGFAREDEANYIAYLTCSLHPDIDYQYAGALFATSYTLNALYGQDRDAYRELYNRLDEGVKRDLAENSKYHEKYDGPIREAFSKSNDVYLKANNQKDGERSYGRMVDLLLAQYRYEKENRANK